MKTIKNRKRKFAFSMKIIAALSCLAIASVGFASWLIIQEPESTETPGSIEVSLTSEAKLELSVSAKKPAGHPEDETYVPQFIFGRPSEANAKPLKWLVPKSDVKIEDLTETFTITATSTELPVGTTAIYKVKFYGIVKDSANYARIEELLEQQYLTLTISVGQGATKVEKTFDKDNDFTAETAVLEYKPTTDVSGGASFDLTISFAWGKAFNLTIGEDEGAITQNWNPYNYFNNVPHSDGNVTLAFTTLDQIAAIVQGTKVLKYGTTDEYFDYQVSGENAPLTYKVFIDAELDLNNVDYPSDN